MKITKEYIQKELFASGDIFWSKKNGEQLLITNAQDVINRELLNKLLDSGNELICPSRENHADEYIISLFEKSSCEISLKKKIFYRNKIIQTISGTFINRNEPSFSLDNLAWKVFGLDDAQKMQQVLIKDMNYFKRSFSIAGAYVMFAFFLGCYDEKFLKNTYSELLRKLLSVMEECPIVKLKNSTELIREKETLNIKDHQIIKKRLLGRLEDERIIFERLDGSGLEGFGTTELSDLERVLIAVNQYFGFSSSKQTNVLDALIDGSLKIDKKIRSIILNEIDKNHIEIDEVG